MTMGAPRRDPSESVLVVDRLASDRRRVAGWLSESGLAVDMSTRIDTPQNLARYGVAMLDVDLLETDWLGELSRLKRELPETEIILTTGPRESSVEAAVEAMKLGAYDYLVKPLDSNRVPVLVRKALERRRLSEENRSLRERLSLKDEYGRVIGKSRSITDVYEIVDQVAGTSATTLLTGESGTGKELVAKAIHKRSPRAARPFVSLNCGALPEGLLESELFGFERGAFTGAVDAKQGKIEMADGGTLFLDEVGEMSTKTQVEFLRVLQEREFRRLGGDRVVRVDVRIIAATNKDLLAEVREGRFRQDLYYRLAVVPIHLPSLRERREDIPLLVDTFLEEFASLPLFLAGKHPRAPQLHRASDGRRRSSQHSSRASSGRVVQRRADRRSTNLDPAGDAASQGRRDRHSPHSRRAHRPSSESGGDSRHQPARASLQDRALRCRSKETHGLARRCPAEASVNYG
jgi:DNA-binding NtrC family response regulator